jgi:hypothetical protein
MRELSELKSAEFEKKTNYTSCWIENFENTCLYKSIYIPVRFKNKLQFDNTINMVHDRSKEYSDTNINLITTSRTKCEFNSDYYITLYIGYNILKNFGRIDMYNNANRLTIRKVKTGIYDGNTIIELDKTDNINDETSNPFKFNRTKCADDIITFLFINNSDFTYRKMAQTINTILYTHEVHEINSDKFVTNMPHEQVDSIVSRLLAPIS